MDEAGQGATGMDGRGRAWNGVEGRGRAWKGVEGRGRAWKGVEGRCAGVYVKEWKGPCVALVLFTAAKHSSAESKRPMNLSVPCVSFVGAGMRLKMFVHPGSTSQWSVSAQLPMPAPADGLVYSKLLSCL